MRKRIQAKKRGMAVLPFLLSCLTAFSQNASLSKDPIVISGKIRNIKQNENGRKLIHIYFPKETDARSKIIYLDNDGCFSDTLSGPEGRYTVSDGNFPYNLYLKPGSKYSISYEARGPLLTNVRLGGDDTLINRYFITRQQEKTFFNPAEKKTEEAFRLLLGNWRQKELKRISLFPLPESIARHDAKAIAYEYLFNLFLFTRFTEMRDTSFGPSAITTRELAIDYDNEEDYKTYGDYPALVYEYYLKKLDSIETATLKKDSTFSLRQNRIKLLSQIIPNKHIRNSIISDIVIYDLKEVKDPESYYNDFLTCYTGNDEKVKEKAADAYLRLTRLKKGTPSPRFNDYINYSGGKNALKDYLGKFVFIDIWATWCGNCWNEFPYIRKLEEKYKEKNIVFISISIDKDKEAWAKTIAEKKLPGVQLLAHSSDDSFLKEYAVYGVPRYILLDKEGKIINYSTPWPSEEEAIAALLEKAGL